MNSQDQSGSIQRNMRWLGVLTLILLLAPAARATEATLYQRLGGAYGVHAIVGQLVDEACVDPRTASYWERVNIKRVKDKLADYVCEQTGGACHYDSDDMQTVHAGLHIHATQFYTLVEHLRSIMDARGVGEREKNELLGVLAPSYRDVVER